MSSKLANPTARAPLVALRRLRPTRPWSLAARLTTWYAVSGFVLVMIATGFLYWVLVGSLDRQDDRFLISNIQVLREGLQNNAGDMVVLKQEVEWEFSFRQYAEVYVRVLDETGRSIVETPGMAEELPPRLFPPAVAVGIEPGRGIDIASVHGKPFRIMAALATVRGPSGPELRAIQVALGNVSEGELLAKYQKQLGLVLGIAFVGCMLASYRIARRGIRPVQEISDAAHRIRSTTLHERIDAAGLPAELFVLAETFNQMLNRLEESFARLSQFSADIAHELRTPINNLRGEAEVVLSKPRSPEEYRESLGSCLEESVRLTQLIDRLLFLARADNPKTQIARERVNVAQELAAVRDFYEAAAAEAGISLSVEAPAGVSAHLDRTLFQRALANLIANAMTYTPRGGRVTLTANRQNGMIRVEVSDTGRGVAPEHLPHIFDRFYRADGARSKTRGGVGLGLAIVKGVMTLHGGSVEVASTVGQGTRVTLVFPPADPPVPA